MVVVAVLALWPVGAAEPTAAAEPAGAPTTSTTDRDTQAYAREFGVSIAEAATRLALEGPASDLAARLEQDDSTVFGGLWIQNTPEYRIKVRFAADPSTVLALTTGSPLDGIVDVLPATYSLDELVAAAQGLRAGTTTVPFDLAVNVQDNLLDVMVQSSTDLAAFTSPDDRPLPPSARIVQVPALMQPATQIYGGLALPDCTTGYSVIKSGTKGTTTAAHCWNSESIYGVSLTFKGELYSGSNDEQWMTSGSFTFVNKAADMSGYPYWRYITSRTMRANQPIGAWVCKYGKVTVYTCGTITATNVAPGYIPNVQPTYVRVAHSSTYPFQCKGGDSGGPVYQNSSAWGIVEGRIYTDTWSDLIYTQTNYVEGGIGVTILTS
jgi:hypothetical protein